MSSDVDGSSLDTIFDLLSHQRRRSVLRCLREHGSLALADLAEETVRHETDSSPPQFTEEEVRCTHASLHHVHVPKLAEEAFVEYNRDRGVVTTAENTRLAEPFLSLEPATDGERTE